MIDFRYHLVSIASIFLALAVGIVLGAGPLKEDIGKQLSQEVVSLRSDKAELRSQLDVAQKGTEARDAFALAGNKAFVAGRLSGKTVALVVLPGANASVVKATTTSLTDAGATIGSTVTVNDSWVDPADDKLTTRAGLGDRLAGDLKLPAADNPDNGQTIDRVLAAAVVSPLTTEASAGLSSQESASSATTPEGARAALEGLRSGDLITFTPDQPVVATSAVVVGAQVTKGNEEEQGTRADGLAALASALDSASSGAVLVSNGGVGSPKGESVVSAARKDSNISKNLSTVDDAGVPMGQATVVLALQQQYAKGAGQYGLGSDAGSPFPSTEKK